ncbi:DUF992 domain-containing protein [Ancylobacter sp. 6x-1]|uniref:DUF992 domain-containing protein n=1 Tax=Ancylobacter crimeensis TaxID=2579147 RepID=A0ABT0D9X6_9HYPH|nr:DUF992 domain-containing protein [Ancylobacter crimeensis]MCK0196761.1 DUF992 domain-containing protein [Ancylobacter crimeensis]
MSRSNFVRSAVIALAAAGTLAAPALAQPLRTTIHKAPHYTAAPPVPGTAAGTLTCVGSPSNGLLIGSHRTLSCTFTDTRGVPHPYQGTISRYGLDVGFTGQNVLVWSVLAPTRALGPDSLSGNYAGVSGSVAVGVGLAGNVLFGGSNDTIALQPFSGESMTGLNLAVGVGDLRLRAL